MPLIFAIVLATQIHTAQDLQTACTQSDTKACDQFIHQIVATSTDWACVPLNYDPAKVRVNFLDTIRLNPSYDRTAPAREFFVSVMDNGCGAD